MTLSNIWAQTRRVEREFKIIIYAKFINVNSNPIYQESLQIRELLQYKHQNKDQTW